MIRKMDTTGMVSVGFSFRADAAALEGYLSAEQLAAVMEGIARCLATATPGYDEADGWPITRLDIFANPKGIYRQAEKGES